MYGKKWQNSFHSNTKCFPAHFGAVQNGTQKSAFEEFLCALYRVFIFMYGAPICIDFSDRVRALSDVARNVKIVNATQIQLAVVFQLKNWTHTHTCLYYNCIYMRTVDVPDDHPSDPYNANKINYFDTSERKTCATSATSQTHRIDDNGIVLKFIHAGKMATVLFGYNSHYHYRYYFSYFCGRVRMVSMAQGTWNRSIHLFCQCAKTSWGRAKSLYAFTTCHPCVYVCVCKCARASVFIDTDVTSTIQTTEYICVRVWIEWIDARTRSRKSERNTTSQPRSH